MFLVSDMRAWWGGAGNGRRSWRWCLTDTYQFISISVFLFLFSYIHILKYDLDGRDLGYVGTHFNVHVGNLHHQLIPWNLHEICFFFLKCICSSTGRHQLHVHCVLFYKTTTIVPLSVEAMFCTRAYGMVLGGFGTSCTMIKRVATVIDGFPSRHV